MKKIAITGSTGSGKSTVCEIMKTLGAFVIDSDKLIHSLYEDPDVVEKIVNIFGKEVLTNNKVDRKKIVTQISQNSSLLTQLEKLIHPIAYRELQLVFALVGDRYEKIVVEAALLFEAGWQALFDVVVAVDAPKSIRQSRSADAFSWQEQRQLSSEEKCLRADFTLVNDQDVDHLKKQTTALYNNL